MENVLSAFSHVLSITNVAIMLLGMAIGIIIGALPGLTGTLGVSLALPFTFGMSPDTGMLMLLGVYCGATFGGSITAILINTPGTPAAAATAIDGYKMTQNGHAGKALTIALRSSVIGGILSGVALMVLAPIIAKYALKFGPPEFFALSSFGLSIITAVSGQQILKGLTMAAFGILFGCVGIDAFDGMQRFTFGSSWLNSGITTIPVMIGIFAIAEMFRQLESGAKGIVDSDIAVYDTKEKYPWRSFLTKWPNILISSLIGVVVGATPGTGGAIASFIAYRTEKARNKKPEIELGEGSPEAVCASETANNATTGATLIPMLTLGIPGDAPTAVLLGALTIHGLRAGPMLFKNNPVYIYTIIIGFLVLNVLMFFEGSLAIKWFRNIIRIPTSVLIPVIVLLCLVGSYASTNTISSAILVLGFGIFGFIMSKFGFPMPPLLIALILSSTWEVALRQSLLMSRGSFSIFFTRPIALVFMLLAIVSLLSSPIILLFKKLKAGKK